VTFGKAFLFILGLMCKDSELFWNAQTNRRKLFFKSIADKPKSGKRHMTITPLQHYSSKIEREKSQKSTLYLYINIEVIFSLLKP